MARPFFLLLAICSLTILAYGLLSLSKSYTLASQYVATIRQSQTDPEHADFDGFEPLTDGWRQSQIDFLKELRTAQASAMQENRQRVFLFDMILTALDGISTLVTTNKGSINPL